MFDALCWIAGGALFLFICWLIYCKATGRQEYNRFVRTIESTGAKPTWAKVERDLLHGGFIRGVVRFDTGGGFHFMNKRAFDKAMAVYHIGLFPGRR